MVISDGWTSSCIPVLMGIGHVDPLRMERTGPIWSISTIAGLGHRTAGISPHIIGTVGHLETSEIQKFPPQKWKENIPPPFTFTAFLTFPDFTPRTLEAIVRDLRREPFFL